MTRCPLPIYRSAETGAMVARLEDTGTIVSAFDKAVNIRVSDRRLVSVVRNANAMTPMGIHCPEAFNGTQTRLRIDSTVTFHDGAVTGDGWAIQMSGSPRFEGRSAATNAFGLNSTGLDLFEKVLHFAGQTDGLLGVTRTDPTRNPFVKKGQKIVGNILSQTRDRLADHLAAFAGLGPGFTPAGDDLLCGFLMGDQLAHPDDRTHLSGRQWPLAPKLDCDEKAVLWRGAQGTSDAGRTLLWMALKRRFPKFLCRTVAALRCADSTKDMLRLVTAAARHGHTSGTDSLTGLLLYFIVSHRHDQQSGYRGTPRSFVDPQPIALSG